MTGNVRLHHNDAVYVPPARLWRAYETIRAALLPITAVRDAILVECGPAAQAR
jgi:hypothetical protein